MYVILLVSNDVFLPSLPESFVVPSILLDMNLTKTAPHFSGHRVPVSMPA